jgi:hypothetical protein
MKDKKEIHELMLMAKAVVSKNIYKKLKSLEDPDEKKEALKYIIKNKLHLKSETIKSAVDKLKSEKKDIFFISLKANTFFAKLKLFNATYHPRDFEKLMEIYNEVKKELKNV